jgi:hypothetical protein
MPVRIKLQVPRIPGPPGSICGSEPPPPPCAAAAAEGASPSYAADLTAGVIAKSVLTTPTSTTSEHAESLFGTQDAEEKAGSESVHVLVWMDVIVIPST